MKKLISICLSLSLLISTILICNVTAYSYDANSFEVWDSDGYGVIISSYYGDDTELVIDDYLLDNPVTEILDNAFMDNTTLEKVTISGSVTTIGSYAFSNCTNLKEVVISDNVTEIGQNAFEGCENLTTVTLSNSITEIKDKTFNDCPKLESINSPANLKVIGGGAFMDCSSLKYFFIPDGVTKIGNSAFFSCTSLCAMSIPDSVTELGSSAFARCESLERVKLPDNLEVIPSYLFDFCKSLTEIRLPDALRVVEGGAFDRCSKLKSIYASDLSHWLEITFSDSSSKPSANLYLNNELVKDLVIPDGITSINNHQFEICQSIETVTLGKDVKTIGEYAFNGCSNLKEVVIPSNVDTLGRFSFNTANLETVTIENPDCEIGNNAFGKTTIKAPHISTAFNYAQEHSSSITFVPTDPHSESGTPYEVFGEPDCTTPGLATYDCDLCGQIVIKELAPTGHNYSESVTAPTCTEQGYTTYTCSVCGDTYIGNYTDALGHNFDDNERYCQNDCGEEKPNYKEEITEPVADVKPTEPTTQKTTVPETTKAVEITKSSTTTTYADKNEYTGSKETPYSDFRIIPGYGQIKVAWTTDNKIDGYEIYISTDNKNFKKAADIKTKNADYFIINNLSAGQAYYIKIKGYLYHNNEKIEMNSFSNIQSLTVK